MPISNQIETTRNDSDGDDRGPVAKTFVQKFSGMLGTDQKTLMQSLQGGQTLGMVAKQNGMSDQDLMAAVKAQMSENMDPKQAEQMANRLLSGQLSGLSYNQQGRLETQGTAPGDPMFEQAVANQLDVGIDQLRKALSDIDTNGNKSISAQLAQQLDMRQQDVQSTFDQVRLARNQAQGLMNMSSSQNMISQQA